MIEDKIVYNDNYDNPLEEIYNAEICVASSISYTKRKHAKQLDVYICPNLTTTYPIIKVGILKTMKEYNELENKAFIHTTDLDGKMILYSYLSLLEARYVTVLNIKNEKLYSNYILNEAELGMLVGALNTPSSYDGCSSSWEECIHRINNFFSNNVVTTNDEEYLSLSMYQKDPGIFARTYRISENRLLKPIYKPCTVKKIPNYLPNYYRLVKNSN